MRIFDSTTKPVSFNGEQQTNLKRNVAIGTASGIAMAGLMLTKGKLRNLPKMDYGIKEVMTLCTGSALGGYIGGNITTKDNFKGRSLEVKNQLIFNDLLPLILLKGVDLLYKSTNKIKRSLVLAGSLLGFTYLGHAIAERSLKNQGLKTNYPVKACHLIADFDDFLLPIAIATKSRGLQNFLKVISPITFFPLGNDVGNTKDKKYYA